MITNIPAFNKHDVAEGDDSFGFCNEGLMKWFHDNINISDKWFELWSLFIIYFAQTILYLLWNSLHNVNWDINLLLQYDIFLLGQNWHLEYHRCMEVILLLGMLHFLDELIFFSCSNIDDLMKHQFIDWSIYFFDRILSNLYMFS